MIFLRSSLPSLVCSAVLTAATLSAAPRHSLLLKEAATAANAGDLVIAVAKLEEAAALRPDYPRIQMNLARLYASVGRTEDVLASLQRLADMGLRMNPAADSVFSPLLALPRFKTIADQLAGGPAAIPAPDDAAFAITDVTGIIESCLIDPVTLDWYFGDVRNRCIWKRAVGTGVGQLVKFTSDEDQLDGVFKLVLSPDRKTLWAATATVGVMVGDDAADGKRTNIIAIDFATGRVKHRYAVPDDGRKHLLGDLILTVDGTVFATDSLSGIIWWLPVGSEHLESWLESDQFLNLQGLAFSADSRSLYVADYANGIWRIDVTTKVPGLLTAPANATFFGLDGIYSVPGGLLAVQNGINPQRVLRIAPAVVGRASPTHIIATGRPDMTDLALGTIFHGNFHFVGNSGWSLFDPIPAAPPVARAVTIHSVAID